MNIIFLIAACLIPYLAGSINFSILISKGVSGEDIRNSGSGNAGATNMLRTYGKGLAILTLTGDILKGVLGVLIGIFLSYLAEKYVIPAGSGAVGLSVSESSYASIRAALPYYKFLSAFFVILGHNFPLYFKFKGGKGVATSLGVILTLNWQVGLIVLAFAIIIMAVTRYVSLGSVMSAVIYIAVDVSQMIFTGSFSPVQLLFDVAIAALLIIRHHANIKRLLNGSESKLGSKTKGRSE